MGTTEEQVRTSNWNCPAGQHIGSNTVEQDVGITATTPQTEREDTGYV